MDYRDIIESISSHTSIINKTLSQTQKIYNEIISPALTSVYKSIMPAMSTWSKIYDDIFDIIKMTTMQASPIISALREISQQLALPSFASLLQNANNLSSCLSDFYEACHGLCEDAFRGTIFETGTESIDDEACEKIIADSVLVTNKLVQSEDKNPIRRKIVLKKIFGFLGKMFASTLLPLLLFIFAPYWQDFYNEHIQPSVYYSELAELQEQYQDCVLRIVVKDTFIYTGKHMRRIVALAEKYEIVEVLEDCGKIIKVKIFESDEVGWIYKKYTKRSK